MKKYESEHYIFNYEEDTYLEENIDMICPIRNIVLRILPVF